MGETTLADLLNDIIETRAKTALYCQKIRDDCERAVNTVYNLTDNTRTEHVWSSTADSTMSTANGTDDGDEGWTATGVTGTDDETDDVMMEEGALDQVGGAEDKWDGSDDRENWTDVSVNETDKEDVTVMTEEGAVNREYGEETKWGTEPNIANQDRLSSDYATQFPEGPLQSAVQCVPERSSVGYVQDVRAESDPLPYTYDTVCPSCQRERMHTTVHPNSDTQVPIQSTSTQTNTLTYTTSYYHN